MGRRTSRSSYGGGGRDDNSTNTLTSFLLDSSSQVYEDEQQQEQHHKPRVRKSLHEQDKDASAAINALNQFIYQAGNIYKGKRLTKQEEQKLQDAANHVGLSMEIVNALLQQTADPNAVVKYCMASQDSFAKKIKNDPHLSRLLERHQAGGGVLKSGDFSFNLADSVWRVFMHKIIQQFIKDHNMKLGDVMSKSSITSQLYEQAVNQNEENQQQYDNRMVDHMTNPADMSNLHRDFTQERKKIAVRKSDAKKARQEAEAQRGFQSTKPFDDIVLRRNSNIPNMINTHSKHPQPESRDDDFSTRPAVPDQSRNLYQATDHDQTKRQSTASHNLSVKTESTPWGERIKRKTSNDQVFNSPSPTKKSKKVHSFVPEPNQSFLPNHQQETTGSTRSWKKKTNQQAHSFVPDHTHSFLPKQQENSGNTCWKAKRKSTTTNQISHSFEPEQKLSFVPPQKTGNTSWKSAKRKSTDQQSGLVSRGLAVFSGASSDSRDDERPKTRRSSNNKFQGRKSFEAPPPQHSYVPSVLQRQTQISPPSSPSPPPPPPSHPVHQFTGIAISQDTKAKSKTKSNISNYANQINSGFKSTTNKPNIKSMRPQNFVNPVKPTPRKKESVNNAPGYVHNFNKQDNAPNDSIVDVSGGVKPSLTASEAKTWEQPPEDSNPPNHQFTPIAQPNVQSTCSTTKKSKISSLVNRFNTPEPFNNHSTKTNTNNTSVLNPTTSKPKPEWAKGTATNECASNAIKKKSISGVTSSDNDAKSGNSSFQSIKPTSSETFPKKISDPESTDQGNNNKIDMIEQRSNGPVGQNHDGSSIGGTVNSARQFFERGTVSSGDGKPSVRGRRKGSFCPPSRSKSSGAVARLKSNFAQSDGKTTSSGDSKPTELMRSRTGFGPPERSKSQGSLANHNLNSSDSKCDGVSRAASKAMKAAPMIAPNKPDVVAVDSYCDGVEQVLSSFTQSSSDDSENDPSVSVRTPGSHTNRPSHGRSMPRYESPSSIRNNGKNEAAERFIRRKLRRMSNSMDPPTQPAFTNSDPSYLDGHAAPTPKAGNEGTIHGTHNGSWRIRATRNDRDTLPDPDQDTHCSFNGVGIYPPDEKMRRSIVCESASCPTDENTRMSNSWNGSTARGVILDTSDTFCTDERSKEPSAAKADPPSDKTSQKNQGQTHRQGFANDSGGDWVISELQGALNRHTKKKVDNGSNRTTGTTGRYRVPKPSPTPRGEEGQSPLIPTSSSRDSREFFKNLDGKGAKSSKRAVSISNSPIGSKVVNQQRRILGERNSFESNQHDNGHGFPRNQTPKWTSFNNDFFSDNDENSPAQHPAARSIDHPHESAQEFIHDYVAKSRQLKDEWLPPHSIDIKIGQAQSDVSSTSVEETPKVALDPVMAQRSLESSSCDDYDERYQVPIESNNCVECINDIHQGNRPFQSVRDSMQLARIDTLAGRDRAGGQPDECFDQNMRTPRITNERNHVRSKHEGGFNRSNSFAMANGDATRKPNGIDPMAVTTVTSGSTCSESEFDAFNLFEPSDPNYQKTNKQAESLTNPVDHREVSNFYGSNEVSTLTSKSSSTALSSQELSSKDTSKTVQHANVLVPNCQQVEDQAAGCMINGHPLFERSFKPMNRGSPTPTGDSKTDGAMVGANVEWVSFNNETQNSVPQFEPNHPVSRNKGTFRGIDTNFDTHKDHGVCATPQTPSAGLNRSSRGAPSTPRESNRTGHEDMQPYRMSQHTFSRVERAASTTSSMISGPPPPPPPYPPPPRSTTTVNSGPPPPPPSYPPPTRSTTSSMISAQAQPTPSHRYHHRAGKTPRPSGVLQPPSVNQESINCPHDASDSDSDVFGHYDAYNDDKCDDSVEPTSPIYETTTASPEKDGESVSSKDIRAAAKRNGIPDDVVEVILMQHRKEKGKGRRRSIENFRQNDSGPCDSDTGRRISSKYQKRESGSHIARLPDFQIQSYESIEAPDKCDKLEDMMNSPCSFQPRCGAPDPSPRAQQPPVENPTANGAASGIQLTGEIPEGATQEDLTLLNRFIEVASCNFEGKKLSNESEARVRSAAQKVGISDKFVDQLIEQARVNNEKSNAAATLETVPDNPVPVSGIHGGVQEPAQSHFYPHPNSPSTRGDASTFYTLDLTSLKRRNRDANTYVTNAGCQAWESITKTLRHLARCNGGGGDDASSISSGTWEEERRGRHTMGNDQKRRALV